MVKKTILVTVAILCGMLHGAILQPAKAAVAFPDVPSNHWAYSTIQWAVDNDVVNGYPDGTFRPSQHVTEAEFLVMFIRAFDELPKVTKMTHWTDPAYLYAEEKNWPTMGAGSLHTVALKADGTVLAAGDNRYGQCDVSGWSDMVAVAAGCAHTVGLKADGTVLAVGSNTFGQCDIAAWRGIMLPDNHPAKKIGPHRNDAHASAQHRRAT